MNNGTFSCQWLCTTSEGLGQLSDLCLDFIKQYASWCWCG